METIVKTRKIVESSKDELINKLSLVDEIIRKDYANAKKYVLDDLRDFYAEIRGADYLAIKKELVAQLYSLR